jgi:hypothetical protein
MQELENYPRVAALLCDLLGIELAEEVLPFELLTRMYRAKLRQPMETVARYEDAGFWWEGIMTHRWPEVKGDRFGGSAEVRAAYSSSEATPLVLKERMPDDLSETVEWLMLKCGDDWLAYDPAMVLHQLTWPIRDLDALLALLEAELAWVPDAETMLLELAEISDEEIKAGR